MAIMASGPNYGGSDARTGGRPTPQRLGKTPVHRVQPMRVIVTGAAQGIGQCVARMLAKDGHALVLADIQEKKVAAVAAELGAQAVRVESPTPLPVSPWSPWHSSS